MIYIAGILLLWLLLAIAVAVWLILPAGRRPALPNDLAQGSERLPKPLAMSGPPLQPEQSTNQDHQDHQDHQT